MHRYRPSKKLCRGGDTVSDFQCYVLNSSAFSAQNSMRGTNFLSSTENFEFAFWGKKSFSASSSACWGRYVGAKQQKRRLRNWNKKLKLQVHLIQLLVFVFLTAHVYITVVTQPSVFSPCWRRAHLHYSVRLMRRGWDLKKLLETFGVRVINF